MIDLVRRKEQLEIWTDKEAGVKNAYLWKDKWIRASLEDLYNLTLGDLFAGRVRLMGEISIDSRKVYIATTAADEASLRVKYQGSVVLNFSQLLGYLKKPLDQDRESLLPSVMMCLTVFPEAQVLS